MEDKAWFKKKVKISKPVKVGKTKQNKMELKGKCTLEKAMKTQGGGSSCIAVHFL